MIRRIEPMEIYGIKRINSLVGWNAWEAGG